MDSGTAPRADSLSPSRFRPDSRSPSEADVVEQVQLVAPDVGTRVDAVTQVGAEPEADKDNNLRISGLVQRRSERIVSRSRYSLTHSH